MNNKNLIKKTVGSRPRMFRVAWLSGLLFCASCFLLFASNACAAGMAKQVQERKMQQQQMMVQQYQQAIAQKQAQEVAMYQQAVAQRQVEMQQVAAYQKAAAEVAAYKQAMQQVVMQRAAEAQAANQVKQLIAQKQAQQVQQIQQAVAVKQMQDVLAYKQAKEVQNVVAQKAQVELNQQIGEYATYLAKRKQALTGQAVAVKQAQTAQQLAEYQAYQQVAVVRQQQEMQAKAEVDARRRMEQARVQEALVSVPAAMPRPYPPVEEKTGPETVVEITDLWNSLDRSSQAWGQIIDNETKVLTVAEYIDRFRKLGIKIHRSPGEYVKLVDALGRNNPGFLDQPFLNALSSAAIMEYDFDNGRNKDELAKQLLGEQNFASNRKRVLGE